MLKIRLIQGRNIHQPFIIHSPFNFHFKILQNKWILVSSFWFIQIITELPVKIKTRPCTLNKKQKKTKSINFKHTKKKKFFFLPPWIVIPMNRPITIKNLPNDIIHRVYNCEEFTRFKSAWCQNQNARNTIFKYNIVFSKTKPSC